MGSMRGAKTQRGPGTPVVFFSNMHRHDIKNDELRHDSDRQRKRSDTRVSALAGTLVCLSTCEDINPQVKGIKGSPEHCLKGRPQNQRSDAAHGCRGFE